MIATLRQRPWIVLCAVVIAGAGLVLRADEPTKKNGKSITPPSSPSKPDSGAASSSKSGTVKVEKGPFRMEVSLKGFFEAAKMTEVSVHLESPTQLLVASVAEPGTVVKKGDVLLSFDLDKIDRALKDLDAEKELADLTLKQAEEELPLLERAAPLDMAAAARAKKEADEDLKHFLETDKGWEEKSAKFSVKNYSDFLEYAKEELKQLQKMYRNKDLTEETEEIILKRQRNRVEMISFFVDEAIVQRDRMLAYEIPRHEQAYRENAAKASLVLDKLKISQPLTLSQKRLALAKAKYDRARSVEHLERMRHDRDAMIVKAPVDGVVYYGRCIRGQWVTASDMGRRLVRGSTMQPDDVLLTIVEPGKLSVRASVDEKDLEYIVPGAAAKVSPASHPDSKLPAKVKSVLTAPIGSGAFDARLELDGSSLPTLTAGMACTAKLVPYRKTDALTVPSSAVFHDDEEPYVYLDGKDKPEKRTVKTGHTSGDRTEITAGLREGDTIRTSKP
jgi:multidrug efflux pump subunit AcrA (membrane-fusion protein)